MPNAKKTDFVIGRLKPRSRKTDLAYFDEEAWDLLTTAAWAARRGTQKGDKRPRSEIEAMMAGRTSARRQRQEAAAQRWLEARRERVRAMRRRPVRNADLILDALADGAWRGLGDIVLATGLLPQSVKPIIYQRLWPAGLVERTANPAWRGRLTPLERKALGRGKVEPRYLWRKKEPAGF